MAVAVEAAAEVSNKKKPFTKERRVVVTGMGVVTSLGHDPDTFYNNLLEGVSGVSEDVNYINAHATSTPTGDLKEYQALLHCFGQNPELRMNSSKSMTGHLLGAAGAVEAVATVQDTRVLVGSTKEQLKIKAALSNSFGFGGHNSSIIFAPYK